MSVAEHLAANLVRERKQAGFSQDAVAFKAEVSRTEISQMERGLRVPRIDTVLKLAGALEITPAELLHGMVWEPASPVYGRFAFPDEGASL